LIFFFFLFLVFPAGAASATRFFSAKEMKAYREALLAQASSLPAASKSTRKQYARNTYNLARHRTHEDPAPFVQGSLVSPSGARWSSFRMSQPKAATHAESATMRSSLWRSPFQV